MKNKKPWLSQDLKSTELVNLGFKEINKLDAMRKFPENVNVLIKFFYHDAFKKNLVESPLFLLDKTILKDLQFLKQNKITSYTAFDFLFMKLKMQEIFPHAIMSSFIYTDNRTKMPRQYIKEKVIPANENQILFDFLT